MDKTFGVHLKEGELFLGKGPWTPYSENSYRHFAGYDSTSKCIFSSSGLEDFYLSSWNGSNISSFNNESAGLLYQNASIIGSAATISFYSNFGHSETMPSVATGRRMLVTLNSGDAQVGQSGSFFAVIGQANFYV